MFICSSFHFICSGIPDLALAILKRIILLCLSDALQPVCQHKHMISMYSKDLLFTRQALVLYKKS